MTAPTPAGPTVTIRITPAIAAEYAARGCADSYDGDHNAYARIDGPGSYVFTLGEVDELAADAGYYDDLDGPGYSLTFGQRSAYGALRRQCLAALEVAAARIAAR